MSRCDKTFKDGDGDKDGDKDKSNKLMTKI